MNAPDKIYVSRNFSEDNSPHGLWYLNKSEHDVSLEYIRKDALLEWAKEKYNEYKQMDEDFQGNVFVGNRHALAEVIQKIESL